MKKGKSKKACCSNGACGSEGNNKMGSCSSKASLGIFLLRFGVGLVFIMHGIAKFTQFEAISEFFSTLGMGDWMVYAVGAFEIIAGLILWLGVYTCITGIALAVYMLIIILWIKRGSGFVGGYEFELLLMLSSIAIAKLGSGSLTICKVMHGDSCDKCCC